MGNPFRVWDGTKWVYVNGVQGPIGPTGPQGQTGPIGPTGPQGPTDYELLTNLPTMFDGGDADTE